MPSLDQQYFSPEQIANYLGLSTYTVQALCREGKLKHSRLGRAIRIKKEWADRFMKAGERDPV